MSEIQKMNNIFDDALNYQIENYDKGDYIEIDVNTIKFAKKFLIDMEHLSEYIDFESFFVTPTGNIIFQYSKRDQNNSYISCIINNTSFGIIYGDNKGPNSMMTSESGNIELKNILFK